MTHPEQLLFQGLEEAFDTAIAVPVPATNAGEETMPQESDLVLKIVAHELGPMIMTESKPGGPRRRESRRNFLRPCRMGSRASKRVGPFGRRECRHNRPCSDRWRRTTVTVIHPSRLSRDGGGIDAPHLVRAMRW